MALGVRGTGVWGEQGCWSERKQGYGCEGNMSIGMMKPGHTFTAPL